ISYSTRFEGAENLKLAHFRDADGYDQERFYKTLAVVDVTGDGNADVCGRTATGVDCAPAVSWLQGFVSGWTTLFGAVQPNYVANFGDNVGWGASVGYWGTVRPARMWGRGAGSQICGRGYGGVLCSNPKDMPVVPEIECSAAKKSSGPGAKKVAIVLF